MKQRVYSEVDKEKILSALANYADGIAPFEFQKVLLERGMSRDTIRNWISRMWGQGIIDFTVERKLKIGTLKTNDTNIR